MAQNPGISATRLIEFSANARRDQISIYDSTAEHWGDEQAVAYANFLLATAQTLADSPTLAPLVPNRPGTRVFVARWKNARQGHRIFFRETPNGILVLRLLHTRMNWSTYLDNTEF